MSLTSDTSERDQRENILPYQPPVARRRVGAITVIRCALLAVAIILFGIAFYFGRQDAFQTGSAGQSVAITSNIMAGLSSLGFSLAGGLALLAVALVRDRE